LAFASAARQLRPSIESVRSLASLDLCELGDPMEVFVLGEAGYCGSLGLDA